MTSIAGVAAGIPPTQATPGAFKTDHDGFIIFPSDSLTPDGLADYLYGQVYHWFEGEYHVQLTEEQKVHIRKTYGISTARRYIARDIEKFIGTSTNDSKSAEASNSTSTD